MKKIHLTKNEKSKDYCKADQSNVYCFVLTIFRLATPAFFRFTDVTEFVVGNWRMSNMRAVTALFTNMRTLKFKTCLHNCVFGCHQS